MSIQRTTSLKLCGGLALAGLGTPDFWPVAAADAIRIQAIANAGVNFSNGEAKKKVGLSVGSQLDWSNMGIIVVDGNGKGARKENAQDTLEKYLSSLNNYEREWLQGDMQRLNRLKGVTFTSDTQRLESVFVPMCAAVNACLQKGILELCRCSTQVIATELCFNVFCHGSTLNLNKFTGLNDVDMLLDIRGDPYALTKDQSRPGTWISALKQVFTNWHPSMLVLGILGHPLLQLELNVFRDPEGESPFTLCLRGELKSKANGSTKSTIFPCNSDCPGSLLKLEFEVSVSVNRPLNHLITAAQGYEKLRGFRFHPSEEPTSTLLTVYEYLKEHVAPKFKKLLRDYGLRWSTHWIACVMLWITLWRNRWISVGGAEFDLRKPAYGLQLDPATMASLSFDIPELASFRNVVVAVMEELGLTLRLMAEAYNETNIGRALWLDPKDKHHYSGFQLHDPFNLSDFKCIEFRGKPLDMEKFMAEVNSCLEECKVGLGFEGRVAVSDSG